MAVPRLAVDTVSGMNIDIDQRLHILVIYVTKNWAL